MQSVYEAAGGDEGLVRLAKAWHARAGLVVVAAIDAEDMLEVAAAEDEGPVEAVGANRAHPCGVPKFGALPRNQ